MVLTTTLYRVKRIIISYINERLCRIRNEFWNTGGDSQHINEYMDENEKEFFFRYKDKVAKFQNSFPIDLNLMTD